MKTTNLEPIPPNANPFNHDLFNMGTPIGENIMIMHAATRKEVAKYIIIVNMTTGERTRVTL